MSNGANSPAKRQGMAIASLVLGILSVMCFGLFAAIPAIILGHTAHRRVRKAPDRYGGGGLAIAGFSLGYFGLLFTTAVLAGLLLPAFAKAKSKAQSIQCVNNLKQIGLGFRVFATHHGDRFPFNVATNETGVQINTPGMDTVQILRALSNELSNPKLLVCPADSSVWPAESIASLGPANVTYQLESAAEVKPSNPQEILAWCPMHGHKLYCDGSVQQRRGGRQ